VSNVGSGRGDCKRRILECEIEIFDGCRAADLHSCLQCMASKPIVTKHSFREAYGCEPTWVQWRPTTMTLQIGDTAPDFEAHTTAGRIRFHEWLGDRWGVLFSHPKDFTPVCTTELGYTEKLRPEFEKRGVRVIGLSVDSSADHQRWADDIE